MMPTAAILKIRSISISDEDHRNSQSRAHAERHIRLAAGRCAALQLSGLLTQTPECQIQRLQIPVQVVFAQRVE